MRISIKELRNLCEAKLVKHGLTSDDALIVADEYIDGELRGRQCHGIAAFPKFAISKLKEKRKPFVIKKETATMLHVEGNGNLGQIVMAHLFPKIIMKAKEQGICMVGIANMHSYLMPGTYARKGAENGLISILCNYGGKARVAYPGTIDPLFATNPLAIGVPTAGEPLVLDMATSSYAMGKVRLAKTLGTKLPDGVAMDYEGRPTCDPEATMHGALFPFGGYKGAGLSLMIEIFSRCLLDVHKDDKGVCRGFFFIFFDPQQFGDLATFKRNVEEIKLAIKSARRQEGVNGVRLPGEDSEAIKEANLKKGYLDIDNTILDQIRAL